MWQMLAGLGGKVVDGVANYASNKQKLKQVKLEGTIETERAKAELEVTKLKNKAEMDMTTLQAKVDKSKAIDAGNLSLDKMSMREATKSFFDEAIATLLLSPFIYLLYYNFKELPTTRPNLYGNGEYAANILGSDYYHYDALSINERNYRTLCKVIF